MRKYLKTTEAETSQQKYWAWLDARETTLKHKADYSPETHLMMERVQTMLSMLHYDCKAEIKYRATLTGVKVFNKNVRDKRMYREYMQHLEELGFEVRDTAQGTNYNIKKRVLEAAA
jgi:N-acetyl-anhydromuramyl-L-alanine amidase AmpD